jgi:type IX secretion system PorP/SprF family membrane protein
MKLKKYIFVSVACVQSFLSLSQDVHFTMFQAAPTVLNPAAAGVFNGTFRTSANYRSQWASVTNKPYTTYSYNLDAALLKNKPGNGYMGLGLTAYRDVAGASNFGTTKIDLTFSGILRMDDYNTMSLGLTGGWGQQSISSSNLQWDSQYDGQGFNAALPSGESFDFQNKRFFDIGTGVLWSYGTGASNIASFDKFSATAGIAYHHTLRPRIQTYYADKEKMYSRIVLYGDLHFAQLYSKVSFIPRFSAIFQGPAREINIGVMGRYLVKDGSKYTGNLKGLAISVGGYYRIMDAFSPSIEIEIAGFTVGYSYDLNLSQLRTASQFKGGSEIYIRFQNPNPFFQFSSRPRLR